MTPCRQWVPAEHRHCDATPTRPYIQGPLCVRHAPCRPSDIQPASGPTLRPSIRNTPVDQAAVDLARKGQLQRQPAPIPACPERDTTTQYLDGLRVRTCCNCGRVTARSDGDGAPWCGGKLPRHLTVMRP